MSQSKFQISNFKSSRGVALVIVLAIIVLVLGLSVGFLARVSTERASAKGYASAVEAKLLANSAVQIVQGQIDAATTQGTAVAWSSQPGLIRTYNNSGTPEKSYKLYSSDAMQSAGALDPATETAALAGWFNTPALFTDINAPVDSRFTGTPDAWPILDPSSLAGNSTTTPPQGFSITGAPTGAYQGVTNAAPMPVRWLYVLQNGQVVSPTGSGNTATVAGADQSPIVGRIAFWTDDETCKVNVNTASEGTYWDIPRASTPTEEALGKFQPSTREFQAYPGHPATTSLSAVFPGLTREEIFQIVPRLQDGGSKNATVSVASSANVTLDTDRLYATADEILFNGNRTVSSALTGNGTNLIERSRFFLSTVSRAPETNLFNLPKIASWPIHATDSLTTRTPFDRLIAQCATLNGYEYFFKRRNPDSMTEDFTGISRNQTLLKYLQTLTGRRLPGFGGILSDKFGSDRDQILTEIFDYIRCTNLDNGGFAGTLPYAPSGQVLPIEINSPTLTARGFGRVPILTEFGLWVICTGAGNATVSANGTLVDSHDPASNKTLFPDDASGKLTANATMRQLRVETAFVFEPFVPMMGYKDLSPDIEILVSGLESWFIRGDADPATDFKNMGFPSEADQTFSGKGRYVLTGKLGSKHASNDLRAGHLGLWTTIANRGVRARNSGRLAADTAFADPLQQFPFVGEPLTVSVATNPETSTLHLTTSPLEVTIRHRPSGDVLQKYQVRFPATTSIPAPYLRYKDNGGRWCQWSFQAGGAIAGRTGRLSGTDSHLYPLTEDATSTTANATLSSFKYSDTVRTIVPVVTTGGSPQSADFRLLAMTKEVPDSAFAKHPLFDKTGTTYRVVNSFVQQWAGWNYHLTRNRLSHAAATSDMGGDSTNLAKATGTYSCQESFMNWTDRHPDTPYPALMAQETGDWDNGVANDIDGPYLNKPDEGVTYSTGGRIPYFTSYQKGDFDAEDFYSPNRVIPSPGMFGSLPTGVKRNKHWQTLLFRRQPTHPSYTDSVDPSLAKGAGAFANAPDLLLLDLFWMPVVEPYAISEPLSTAGKINLNQQIVPFVWIQRETGMAAILKNEKMIAIPNNTIGGPYKSASNDGGYKSGSKLDFRRPVNIPATLSQLQFRFDNTDGTGLFAFRSAAEICDMHIVPDDASVSTADKASLDASMKTYWEGHALTGDNSRERIYTTIYPRLTTKSNTFTVHFRAQSLKQAPGSTPGQWVEGKDLVTADYRGSTTIERFIDPNDRAIPDYAADPDVLPTLDSFYHWRVRSHHQFAP